MSLFETNVEKIVAYVDEWEREKIASSEEAMQNFIVDNIRTEFDDSNIIGIKFLISVGDSEPDETIWYLNPVYSNAKEVNYKLASEIVPEVIFLPYSREWLLERYDAFYRNLMKENKTDISDETKYIMFVEFLQTDND